MVIRHQELTETEGMGMLTKLFSMASVHWLYPAAAPVTPMLRLCMASGTFKHNQCRACLLPEEALLSRRRREPHMEVFREPSCHRWS